MDGNNKDELVRDSEDTTIHTGWVDRGGRLHRCRYRNHVSYADLVLGVSERELEDRGWIKLYRTHGPGSVDGVSWAMRHMGRMTVEQARRLARLGFDVLEDDVTHG